MCNILRETKLIKYQVTENKSNCLIFPRVKFRLLVLTAINSLCLLTFLFKVCKVFSSVCLSVYSNILFSLFLELNVVSKETSKSVDCDYICH